MSFKHLITLIAAVAATAAAWCQRAGMGLTPHRGEVTDGYNYWLYNPDDAPADTTDRKPLIIFLHGASLCGTNLDRVRTYGTLDAIEKGRELDTYVLAPQNPGGSWSPRRIANILDHVMANQGDVDPDRIYVLGMSLGGYGTIDLVKAYPERFAAAMALCGGGTGNDFTALNQVPLWIVHGTADRAVTIAQSDRVAASMRAAPGGAPRLIYTRVPGMDHAGPARLLYLPDSYDWLLSHSLQDEDRPVNTSFDIKTTINSAYAGLRATSQKSAKKSTKKSTRKSKRRRR